MTTWMPILPDAVEALEDRCGERFINRLRCEWHNRRVDVTETRIQVKRDFAALRTLPAFAIQLELPFAA